MSIPLQQRVKAESDFEEEDTEDVRDPLLSRHAVPSRVATPVIARAPIPAYIIIPIWISLSGGVILYNKYIFASLHFPYPVFLTAYHMTVATIATQCLKLFGTGRLKPKGITMSWDIYIKRIVPLAALFSGSLILSNIAYLYLSVSFVQMLKAFIPILTLIVRLIVGIQEYSHFLLVLVLVTSIGCSIAASGEVKFSTFGFICQIAAIITESCRLVVIEVLLKDFAMDPLTSIALYAPLCAGMIGLCIPVFEGTAPFENLYKLGPIHMILNGAIAFALNIAGLFLIESAGSVVLTLSGVAKDILLLTLSTIIFGSLITVTQGFGYALALFAIVTFKLTGGSAQKALQGFNYLKGLPDRNDKSKSNVFRLAVFAVPASIILLTWISMDSNPSPSHWTGHSKVSEMVTYPLNTAVEENGKGRFGLWTQHGSGLDIIPPFDDSIDVKQLPLIAWVIVATPDAIEKYGHLLNQIACYCAQKGIPFFLDHQVYVDDRHFFTARHRSVAKYLRYYQWVFATDADTFIANSTRDLREWIDDSVDAVFGDRVNKEILAFAFFLKNSPGGWSFLRRWFSWSDSRHNINYDNGDLVEMVGAGVRPGMPNNKDDSGRISLEEEKAIPALKQDGTEGCLLRDGWGWYEYSENLEVCIDALLTPWRYADDTKPYWDTELWNWTTNEQLPPTKFRSYKTLSGFARLGEGKSRHQVKHGSVGLPGDFLFGGKAMEELLTIDAALCTGKPWQVKEQWDLEKSREYIGKELGYTWWPHCWENGVNLCKKDQMELDEK